MVGVGRGTSNKISQGAALRRIAQAAIIAIVLAASVARAQVISIEYDVNTPAYTGPQDSDHEQYATDPGVSLRIGWLSRRYAASEKGNRWSLFLGHQAHDTIWQTSNTYTAKNTATTIELGHDWRIYARARLIISAGASAGLILVSSKSIYSGECDSPFCNLPDGGWQLSGYSKCEVPISSEFGMMLGIRGRLMGPGREEVFPFAPGPIFSIGLQFAQ